MSHIVKETREDEPTSSDYWILRAWGVAERIMGKHFYMVSIPNPEGLRFCYRVPIPNKGGDPAYPEYVLRIDNKVVTKNMLESTDSDALFCTLDQAINRCEECAHNEHNLKKLEELVNLLAK